MFKDIVALTKVWRLIRWWKGGREGMDTSRLGSRKLWVTIIGSVVLTLLSVTGVEQNIVDTVKWVLITYLGAQGLVDLSANMKAGK